MIVPGSPHAFMLAAADPLDDHLVIGHSVRLRSSAVGRFSKTLSVTTDRRVLTFSAWIKRGALGGSNIYYASDAGQTNYSYIYFNAADELQFETVVATVNKGNVSTVAKFRDPAATLHLVLSINFSTPAVNIYVNGVAQSLTVNTALVISDLAWMWIGATQIIGSNIVPSLSLDGYLSYVHCIDGQALTPSSFGFTHPKTGQWRPKRYTGTYGTNGFHLDFSDGSAATAAALGADRSGNGNNWTPTNISVTAGVTQDWLLDTPTNNYPVFNPLEVGANAVLYYSGNMEFLANFNPSTSARRLNMPMRTGKWYAEARPMNATSLGGTPFTLGLHAQSGSWASQAGDYVGSTADGWGFRLDGFIYTSGVPTAYGTAVTLSTDVVNMAFDADAGKLWIGKNGTWMASGNPATGANPTFSGLAAGAYLFAFGSKHDGAGSAQWNVNSGQQPFVHAAPSGFTQGGTKAMPKPTTLQKSTNGFVTVTDSGANIAATLAALRSGWTDYIEIFKRREAVEGWRWRFSSDLANYLDSSSTAAKAAFPSLTGTSYVGYALNVKPSCGIATGTFVHVNGVADTITDGLGQTRKMILLKREDSTSDWLVYHPDLTAGKLLYLNLTSAETVDASISTVLSNSFVAAAALASGTYRWVALAEVDGFLKLSKHTGNGATDGPFVPYGFTPAFAPIKRIDAIAEWWTRDVARGPSNENTPSLNLGGTDAEFGSAADFVANGQKLRSNDPHFNATGGAYIHLNFAAFPFRYANAR